MWRPGFACSRALFTTSKREREGPLPSANCPEARSADGIRMTAAATIHAFLVAHRHEAEAFLADLVRVPSDNPPGDCAPHAERTARLLESMGLKVERHVVPQEAV